MGWFKNSNDSARAFNNTIMNSYGEKLGQKYEMLTQHRDKAAETASVIDALIILGALAAPALTAPVQQLAQELLEAQTNLKAHSDEINQRLFGTTLEMQATLDMLNNYAVPRLRREVNMSGVAMASLSIQGLEELELEIPVLKQTHLAVISKAQETAKKAANMLNNQ